MKIRLNSIGVKVVAVPLVLLFLAMLSLGVVNGLLTRNSMLELKRAAGVELLEQIDDRVEDNLTSLLILEDLLENTLISVVNLVIANQASISNELLTELADHLQVSAIHWYNPVGVITYSAYGEYIGWEAPSGDHPIALFRQSDDDFLIEEIRQDTESNNYFKYAYGRAPDGSMIQVGIDANAVQALTEQFSLERLMMDMADSDEVVYAVFLTEQEILATSDSFALNELVEDVNKALALRNKVEHYALFSHPKTGETIYDMVMPVYQGGEYYGSLNIGFSMADVYAAIVRNIWLGAIVGIVFFSIVGFVLYLVSINIVRTIFRANEHLDLIASGDLQKPVPTLLIDKGDELGAMGRAIGKMQDSLKTILAQVYDSAIDTARASQELSASTEQTSASIEEVAGTTNEFASTVEMMGSNVVDMVEGARDIQRSASEGTSTVSQAVNLTTALKESMIEMAQTVSALGEESKQIGQIVEVITDIAEQTNLLALNAAIEAARAGEHGRGFAVVADEVRKLAEQSAQSTTQITELVRNMQVETERTVLGITQGSEDAQESAQAVDRSGELLNTILEQIEAITSTMADVSRGIEMISSGSEELAATTEEQSASVESIAGSTQELSHMSEKLQNLVQQFKL